jgi:large subunit ribosomal protein L29
MKAKELIEKDTKALTKLLGETEGKIVKDRFAIAGRELTKVSEVNKSRKLIAKIKTILREREIFEAEKAANPSSHKAANGQEGDK